MIAVVAIIVVLIAGLLVAAEFIARSAVANTVRSLVVQQVGLPADQQVDVEVPGIVLPQLLKGRLDQVAVSADDVALGPLNGDVRVDLQDVPVAGDAPAAGDRHPFASIPTSCAPFSRRSRASRPTRSAPRPRM